MAASEKTFKNIFVFASIPCLVLAMYAAYVDHSARKKRGRPKYINYAYLNVRKKPFPWGDGNHSLFHNPHTQYVPGVGFEDEHKK
ncbi:cytochrome c oxidase subunit VIa [Ostertagia ostertagi]